MWLLYNSKSALLTVERGSSPHTVPIVNKNYVKVKRCIIITAEPALAVS